MEVRDILLKHVCPGLGDLIALIMFGSPLPAVLQCNKNKCLGELNALPFAAMAVNCTAWVFYALLINDFYIYFGNLPGMLLGMFYVLTCYKFSKEPAQDVLRNIFILAFLLYWAMGLVSMAGSFDAARTKTLWGATSVAVLGVYYTAPLSSVAKVIAERDSSSLYWPLCSMNIINGMLWFAYGLALKDWFVALPNGIGAGFNAICLILCFIFPAKRRKQQQHQQQQQQQRELLNQINPGANWGALRVQSIARRPGDSAAAPGADPVGGFFDLAQLRWRTGKVGSFRNSFSKLLGSRGSASNLLATRNSTRNSSASQLASEADGAGAGAGAGGSGDTSIAISLDQQLAAPVEACAKTAAATPTNGADAETAQVIADARAVETARPVSDQLPATLHGPGAKL